MKFRRRAGNVAREEVFLNLTSLIDVIFVLLLFFVVLGWLAQELAPDATHLLQVIQAL